VAKLRRVRRGFREEVLQLVSAGEGNFEKLMQLAEASFADAGYHEVLRAFWAAEVSNAVSSLRTEGLIETIGKKWKPVSKLTGEDVDVISIRRKKRLRGELKAQKRLAHEHGRIDEAVAVGRMLDIVSEQLHADEQPVESASVS